MDVFWSASPSNQHGANNRFKRRTLQQQLEKLAIVVLTALMSGKRHENNPVARADRPPSLLAPEIRHPCRTDIYDSETVIQRVKYRVHLIAHGRYSLRVQVLSISFVYHKALERRQRENGKVT